MIRIDRHAALLAGALVLAAPACTSLLGTFELGGAGGGGGTSTATNSSASTGGGGSSISTGDMAVSVSASAAGSSGSTSSSSGTGGSPPQGTPQSGLVFGAAPPAFGRVNAVRVDPGGATLLAGAFSQQIDLGGESRTCGADYCGFVASPKANGGMGWTQSLGSATAGDHAEVFAAALAGTDVLVTGQFLGLVTTPAGCSGLPLISATPQVFVARFDGATGACKWARSTTINGSSTGRAVAWDAVHGAVVVGGAMSNTISFGGMCPPIVGQSSKTGYLAQLDGMTGQCLWSRAVSVTSDVTALAVDPGGHVMATGSFQGTLDLDCPGGAKFMSPAMMTDLWLAKMDPGNSAMECLWSRAAGASGIGVATGIALTTGGDVVVSGNVSGTATFSAPSCAVDAEPSPAGTAVLARYGDATGACVWAARYDAQSTGLDSDGAGDLRLTGTFEGTVSLGGSMLVNPNPISGQHASFAARISPAGAHVWSRAFAVFGSDVTATAIAVNLGSGASALVGGLDGTVDFGGGVTLLGDKSSFLLELGP